MTAIIPQDNPKLVYDIKYHGKRYVQHLREFSQNNITSCLPLSSGLQA